MEGIELEVTRVLNEPVNNKKVRFALSTIEEDNQKVEAA